MFTYSIALWALVGCGLGLFVRSAVFRHAVPAGSTARRDCPACGVRLLPRGTVVPRPLSPTGRCPACRARIGPPPVLPEALTAAAFTVAASATPGRTAPIWCWLAVFGTTLALVDIRVHRLPDTVNLVAGIGLLVILGGMATIERAPEAMGRAVLAATVLGAFHLTICLTGRIGMGDTKLALVLGLALGWLSWTHVVLATLAAFLLAGTYAAALLATRRAQRHAPFAFGPFMLIGTALALASAGARGP